MVPGKFNINFFFISLELFSFSENYYVRTGVMALSLNKLE